MVGTWRGAEVPTGHPLDGLLAASGWWGKQFLGGESVHPLLFPTADGAGLWAMNPLPAFGGLGLVSRIPLLRNRSHARLITAAKPVLGTTVPKARLRTTRYRGVDSATMIYDQLPINDVFRGLDDDTVLGAMDLRGSPRRTSSCWCATTHWRFGTELLSRRDAEARAAVTSSCGAARARPRRRAGSAAVAPRRSPRRG